MGRNEYAMWCDLRWAEWWAAFRRHDEAGLLRLHERSRSSEAARGHHGDRWADRAEREVRSDLAVGDGE